jgi:hypothetical protein
MTETSGTAKPTTKRKSRAKKPAPPAEVVTAPVEPESERMPVVYPPQEDNLERPEIVVPEEVEVEAVEVEPETPLGKFVVTDRASYGPVKLEKDGKAIRIQRGVLYPFENNVFIGQLLTKGIVRVATDEDKANFKTYPSGPTGPITTASMEGVGLKRK